jgi:chitinase
VVYEDVHTTIVDNDDPNVALTVPAAPLYGTIALTAVADDDDPTPGDESSGMASVAFEFKRSNESTWTSCGVDTSSPYTCSLDTRSLSNANYDFRATGTDVAGNTYTPTAQTRAVDNTPWATLTAPTAGSTYLQGSTVTVSANGYAPTGIDSMTLQYDASTAGTSWVNICTDTGAPYSCSWNTTNIPSGTTTLRAVMNRTGGGTTNSGTTAVTLEQLRAFDVQAANVNNQGYPAPTDTLTLYYSTTVNLGTIRAGWNGSGQATTVTFNASNVGSPSVPGSDYLSFASGINLGQVAFGQDYVQSNRQVGFNATMSAATVTYGGRQVTAVTITLGSQTGGAYLTDRDTTTGTLRWTPSASVTDTFGHACLTTTQAETGTADVDL